MKVILFDIDGMLNHSEWFSIRLIREYGASQESITDFFTNIFPACRIGKKDLKEELVPYLPDWSWHGTVDELLSFWFEGENSPDMEIITYAQALRQQGIRCDILTNQEKNRLEYITHTMKFGKYFDHIYSSCDLGFEKPDDRVFQLVYEDISKELQIDKGEIMYWDDEQDHVDSGSEFGFKSTRYVNFDDFKSRVTYGQKN